MSYQKQGFAVEDAGYLAPEEDGSQVKVVSVASRF